MASQAQNGPRWRNNPFSKSNATPSPGPPPGHARSKSAVMQSPLSNNAAGHAPGHSRTNSLADMGFSSLVRSDSKRLSRTGSPAAGTFAPKFVSSELDGSNDKDKVGGIEGENDFSGKRYVWVKDSKDAFVRGWVVEDLDKSLLRVQCDDGSVSELTRIGPCLSDQVAATRCRCGQCGQGQSGQV